MTVTDFSVEVYTSDTIPKDKLRKASFTLAIAQGFNYGGEFRKSIEKSKEAMELFGQIGSWDNYFNAYGLMVRNHLQLGEFDALSTVKEDMIAFIKEKKLPFSSQIQPYFISGMVNHSKGFYKTALDEFNTAINIVEKDGLDLIGEDEITGDLFPKIDSLQKLNEYLVLGHTYTHAAFSYRSLGEFDNSLNYFKKAAQCYKNTGIISEIFGGMINVGSAYSYRKEREKCISVIEKVLEDVSNTSKDVALTIVAYKTIADAYFLDEKYEKQFYYLEQIEQLLEEPGSERLFYLTQYPVNILKASFRSQKSLNQALRGDFQNALTNADAALLGIQKYDKYNFLLSGIYLQLGRAYEMSSDYQKSIEACQMGLELQDERDTLGSFYDNPKPENIRYKFYGLQLLSQKARTLQSMSKAEKSKELDYLSVALEASQLSMETFELMQRDFIQEATDNVRRERGLVDMNKVFHKIFMTNISIGYDLYEITREEKYKEMVFHTAEVDKSFALRQALNKVEQYKDFPIAEREKLNQIETELFFFDKEIKKAEIADQSDRKVYLESKQLALQKEYDGIIEYLKSNPGTARFYRDQFEPLSVSIESTQRMLMGKEKTAVFEFYEVEGQVYSHFISAMHSEVWQSEKPANWEALISELQKLILNRDLILEKELINKFVTTNKKIVATLFPENCLELIKELEELIIIPHGKCHDINFSILITDAEQLSYYNDEYAPYPIANLSTLEYLINDVAISYAPSVAILLNDQKDAEADEKYEFQLMGFAPVYQEVPALVKGDEPLGNLPDEIGMVLPLFDPAKTTVIKGEDADEAGFRKLVKEHSANIFHISAHGKLDPNGSLFSKLILSDVVDHDTGFDNDLQVAELYNMRINTELAILSACSSGRGEIAGSAGKISMARGFAYANCPGIIMSMWDLDIDENLKIIKDLYVELVDNKQSVSKALQAAQLNYLQEAKNDWEKAEDLDILEKQEILSKMNPYYWAGLVPVGRTNPLSFQN
ncbi:MAG: CHAT domain-containing protein [Saprospiraceae bacterium]